LTISKAALIVKAEDATRLYGAVNPAFTGSIAGIQNGDNITASYSTAATQASPVGSYSIVPTVGDGGSNKISNYSMTITNGTLTVTPATLTVKAADATRSYGAANPVFSGSISGIQNGDNVTATYLTTATVASPVGTYAITPTLSDAGTGKLNNYSVSSTNGTLTITPATLTITADGGKTKLLGATFTAFTGSVTGLQNGDTVSVIYASAGAAPSAAVGSYDITVANVTFTSGSASNYKITQNTAQNGLTVSYNLCPLYDSSKAVKSGAAYPIKLYVCTITGADVSSPGIVLNATKVTQIAGFSGPVEDAGNANPDGNFRYDATLGPSGGYIFNLKTTGLTTGTYNLNFTVSGVSSSYTTPFGVK
jgi:hypothetical protein